MAKNRKVKRRAPRTPRRRNRQRRMTAAPPLMPFNRSLMNTTLRGSSVKTFASSALLTLDFTTDVIFSAYASLVNAFREVKVQRVKVWVYTSLSSSSSGLATMIVAPKDEINAAESLATVTSSPGAITRKIWQPFHGVYYPTEPDERNWFTTSDKRHLFVLQFYAQDLPPVNSANEKRELQIVWDAHVRFRGQSSSTKAVYIPSRDDDACHSSKDDDAGRTPSSDFEQLNIDPASY